MSKLVDHNADKSQIDYPDTTPTDGELTTMEDEYGYFMGCPTCLTDGHLIDNIVE